MGKKRQPKRGSDLFKNKYRSWRHKSVGEHMLRIPGLTPPPNKQEHTHQQSSEACALLPDQACREHWHRLLQPELPKRFLKPIVLNYRSKKIHSFCNPLIWKFDLRGQGGGAAGKTACCGGLRTWVWYPETTVEGDKQLPTSLLLTLISSPSPHKIKYIFK